MRKSIFSILISLIVCGMSVLSGCGNQEARSDKVVSNKESDVVSEDYVYDPETGITITGWLEEPYTKNLLAYLAEKYPEYQFEYHYVGKKSYESITDAELASGLAADIVMVNPVMARKHGKNGYIEDLTKYCDVFSDEAWNAFSYEGKMYVIPSTSEYLCTFYNRAIFETLGRNMPNKFDEYLEFCDYVIDEKGIKPLSCGIKDSDLVADNALAFLAANYFNTDAGRGFGDRLSKGDTTFQEEILPYLYQWKELVNHRVFVKEMCIMDSEAAIEAFTAGDTLMYLGRVEDYNRIIEKNPEIRVGTIGVAGAVQGTPVLIGGCNCGFAVNTYCRKKDIVIEIVSQLASEEGQRALWNDRIGSTTYLKGVEFKNPTEFDGLRPTIHAGRVYLPWTEWGEHGSQIYEIFGKELQRVVTGDRSLDVAVRVIDYEVSQLFEDN